MSYNVIIEDEAEQEIDEATRWIAQYSPEKATFWYFDIQDAILSLENFPFRCAIAPENKFFPEEIRHLLFEDYRILYTVRDENVHILHVRHAARDTLKPEDE